MIWTRLAPNPLADDGSAACRRARSTWNGKSPPTSASRASSSAASPRRRPKRRTVCTSNSPACGPAPSTSTGSAPAVTSHRPGAPAQHPSPGRCAPLTMCFASCSNYEQGWFTAYRRLAEEHPDLVVHLGDYQYEYAAGRNGAATCAITSGPKRSRWPTTDSGTRSTRPTRTCRPRTRPRRGWRCSTTMNWPTTGPTRCPGNPQPAFLERRAAALQAYYENMPLRRSARPRGIDMQLYRRVHWGALATFHLLDTRQYRDDQPCGDELRSDCAERLDPARSLLGDEQERWLLDGFRAVSSPLGPAGPAGLLLPARLDAGSGTRLQPGRLGRLRRQPGPDRRRAGPLAGAQRRGAHRRRPFALGGRGARQLRRSASPVVATELVTTSISSGGDGSDSRDDIAAVLAENPHIRYFSNRRGYVRTRITPDELAPTSGGALRLAPGRRSADSGVVRGARPSARAALDVRAGQGYIELVGPVTAGQGWRVF